MLRALLTPAALSAADARKKARQIAAVLRDLATRTPRPTWVDVGDVSEGLRRELKRLRISYGQADLDDAIAWVNTNLRLTPSAPATARRHRGAS
jgi:hypothetical protein